MGKDAYLKNLFSRVEKAVGLLASLGVPESVVLRTLNWQGYWRLTMEWNNARF